MRDSIKLSLLITLLSSCVGIGNNNNTSTTTPAVTITNCDTEQFSQYTIEPREEEKSLDSTDVNLTALKLARYLLKDQKDSLATLFSYPIKRAYPTRDIVDENDFVKRYAELFDAEFCERIINNLYEWTSAGWRGVVFGDGELWLADHYGKVYEINHTTKLGVELNVNAMQTEYASIHEDVKRNAQSPLLCFKSQNGAWYGRIDFVAKGSSSSADIQLALYKSTTAKKDTPDYLLLGVRRYEGSAGNAYYDFLGEKVSFTVGVATVYSSSQHPYDLNIRKNTESSKSEDGELIDIDLVYWEDLVDG